MHNHDRAFSPASYQHHASISPLGNSMSDIMPSRYNHVHAPVSFSCQGCLTQTHRSGQAKAKVSDFGASPFASACVQARIWGSSGQAWRDWPAARRVGLCLNSADAVSPLPSVVLPCRRLQPLTGRPERRLTRSALGPQTIVPPPLTSCPHTTSRLASAPSSRTLVSVHLTCTIYQLYPPQPSSRPPRLLAEHQPHRRYRSRSHACRMLYCLLCC
jgi:hypothetical protein